MKDLISVIIPVYNVDPYLEDCLESIINQEYDNLEIILVDDGSTDRSGLICDEYAEKDKRIKVFHKENGGLSDARNFGLDIATGEYISFIDSDDYILSNYFSYLEQLISADNADIAVCQFIYVDEKGAFCELGGDRINETIIGNTNCMQYFLYSEAIDTTAWRKLFRRSLFINSGISFPKGRYHEDIFTTYKLIGRCNVIAVGSECLYAYRKRESSIVNSHFSPKRLDAIDGYVECYDYINTYYPQFRFKVSQNIINSIIVYGVKMLNSNVSASQYLSSFQSLFRKHVLNYLRSAKSIPNYIYAILGSINIRLLLYVSNIKNKY